MTATVREADAPLLQVLVVMASRHTTSSAQRMISHQHQLRPKLHNNLRAGSLDRAGAPGREGSRLLGPASTPSFPREAPLQASLALQRLTLKAHDDVAGVVQDSPSRL